MMKGTIAKSASILIASILLCAPSFAVLSKYSVGYTLVILVPLIYLVLLHALTHASLKYVQAESRDVRWILFVGIIISLLIVAFLVVYPIVNASLPGSGSDRDDALNLAAAALLRGNYLYSNLTYLGNPITPLPGAVILSLPFVVLGNSAYQALPWILMWLFAVRRAAYSRLIAIATVSIVLLSPEVLRETVTGGDLFVNGVYVCLTAAWLAYQAGIPVRSLRWLLAAAALFGLALASRPNFMVIWPIVIGCVVRSGGLRVGVFAALSSLAVLVVAIAPVFLLNPSKFSPFHVVNKLDFVAIPNAALMITAASISLSMLLASITHRARMMWDCTIATCLPLILTTAFASLDAKALVSYGLSYGLCYLPFLGWAIAARQHERARASIFGQTIRRKA